jgi:hypothetical protein
MNIIYTVCNRTNLTHALTLADSVFQYQPDHIFYICWVDPIPLVNVPKHVKILSVADVNIPQWEQMESQYTDFELLAACRPWVALALLSRHPDGTQITFFAPTVVLLKSYNDIADTGSAILLTPNIVKPLATSRILDDKRILNIGMFHSGSWVLKTSPETLKVLQWWAERTTDRARYDLCEGLNMDQLWLNYLPIWIPETSVIRHPGWHYGLHAVLNRKLVFENSMYQVDNKPLISVDFTGLDYFDPVWSDHAALLSHNHAFRTLFNKYRAGLKKHKSYEPEYNSPGFGKVIEVRKFRVLRNNIAKKLTSLTQYIDQF